MESDPHGNKTILVVDDDPFVQDALSRLLRVSGFAAATAGNGREALDYLHTHPAPGVIVLDLTMPVMDGLRFRQAQLEDAELARIPVVVCTARDDFRDHPDLQQVCAFLTKPVDPGELLDLLAGSCQGEDTFGGPGQES